jgi:dTDP-4-amino-4,6-dideoxygalactose transaminase
MTPKTKAAIIPHLFGNIAAIAEIEALGIPVVEDAAQAAGSIAADGSRPGALGTIATFSFYPSKNLGAFGDGGAITTGSAELADTVRALRFHGSRDKVDYEMVGYNSRLDEIQAAVLRVQLPHLDDWAAVRNAAGERYAELLEGVVGLPRASTGSRPAWHLYVVRHPRAAELVPALAERGVGARRYYATPIHAQAPMRDYAPADPATALPNTVGLAAEHLAIPISAAISGDELEQVAKALRELTGS